MEDLLQKLTDALDPDTGPVSQRLVELVHQSPSDLASWELDALCRKIQVTGGLHSAYDGNGWGQRASDHPAPSVALAVAAIILAERAEVEPETGLRWKWINAALVAADLYQASGNALFGEQIRSLTRTVLERDNNR